MTSIDGEKNRASFALSGFPHHLGDIPEPPARVRVLSPFDPLLRDRNRAERLFGFFYRIEIFVPEPKREYGYYVFPLLEGDRMIGRIDMKAERKVSSLDVKRLWLEKGVRPSAGRLEKLDAELQRVARFVGMDRVTYLPGWRGVTGHVSLFNGMADHGITRLWSIQFISPQPLLKLPAVLPFGPGCAWENRLSGWRPAFSRSCCSPTS